MVATLTTSLSTLMLPGITVKNTFIECQQDGHCGQMKRQMSDSLLYTRGVREELSAPPSPRKCISDDSASTAASSHDDEVELFNSGSEDEATLPFGCVTVMLRHLPVKCSQPALYEELTKAGFSGTFDFLYVPVNHKQKRSRGFAFVNFVSPDDAIRFFRAFHGKRLQEFHANQPMAVVAADVQGFEATVEQFKNTAAQEGRGAAPLVLRPKAAMSFVISQCAQCGKQCAPSWTFCPCCGNTLS